MTVSNMSIEWGARAGLIAPDETTFRFLEGRPGVQEPLEQAIERWSHYTTDADADVRPRARRSTPPRSRRRSPGAPTPARRRRSPGSSPTPANEDEQRALDYMGLKAGAPLAGHAGRPRLHRLVHERPPGRPARGRRGRARQARRGRRAGAGRAGLDAGQGRGRGRGPRSRLRRRGLRVAQRRMLDVPRHEPGRGRARGARGLDLQPQLRGPAGPPRADAPDEPGDGRRGRHHAAASST